MSNARGARSVFFFFYLQKRLGIRHTDRKIRHAYALSKYGLKHTRISLARLAAHYFILFLSTVPHGRAGSVPKLARRARGRVADASRRHPDDAEADIPGA